MYYPFTVKDIERNQENEYIKVTVISRSSNLYSADVASIPKDACVGEQLRGIVSEGTFYCKKPL